MTKKTTTAPKTPATTASERNRVPPPEGDIVAVCAPYRPRKPRPKKCALDYYSKALIAEAQAVIDKHGAWPSLTRVADEDGETPLEFVCRILAISKGKRTAPVARKPHVTIDCQRGLITLA